MTDGDILGLIAPVGWLIAGIAVVIMLIWERVKDRKERK